MKSTGTIIFLGLLGICLGQGFGGMQAGGEVVWTDDYALDDMGSSPIIITSGMGRPDPSFYRGYQTTTPAPEWGIGGALGSETEVEADVAGSETVKVMFLGYPLKLSCNVTNNESISFGLKWFKDDQLLEKSDHIKFFVANASLLIMKPGREDTGDYRCETSIDINDDKPLGKSFKVIFFEIRKMEKSTNIDKGEDLTIECPVEGDPYPIIQWKKDDVPIYDIINETRITITSNEKNVPNATLTVSKAEWFDRGNFTCNITTLSNSFERFTFVRVKDVYAALWPFIGIVIEVLLLGIIIFIFEKRRAKAEFEESDTDQGNDQKNTADHNKDSVRQRK